MGSLSIVLLSCLLAKGILAATAFSDSNDPIAKVDSFRDLFHSFSNRCPPGKFQCNNGRCIAGSRRCDGHPDCGRWGEDEAGCRCRESGQFQCLDGECISRDRRCNGYFDCSTREDEFHCGACVGDKFLCPVDGICVSQDFRCNGTPDCNDRTDEHDCNLSSQVYAEDHKLLGTSRAMKLLQDLHALLEREKRSDA